MLENRIMVFKCESVADSRYKDDFPQYRYLH